jgi:hypothetical protein
LLYLHCGWPRTGTTGLQKTLSRFTPELAEAGIYYPERWRESFGPVDGHHGLESIVRPLAGGEETSEPFLDFLREHSDRDILMSSEHLTSWVTPRMHPDINKRLGLLALVQAAQEVVPVMCLFTLRRMDLFFSSMYTQEVIVAPQPSPGEYFQVRLDWAHNLIAGMAVLVGGLPGIATCVRYESDGSHQDLLLDAVGVPRELRSRMVADIFDGPRLGVRLTRKALTSLRHFDVVEERAGCRLDRQRLAWGYWKGQISFEEDLSCVLAPPSVRAEVAEAAMRAAVDTGFEPYVSFYENELSSTEPETEIDPSLLTDSDIERIVALVAKAPAQKAAG